MSKCVFFIENLCRTLCHIHFYLSTMSVLLNTYSSTFCHIKIITFSTEEIHLYILILIKVLRMLFIVAEGSDCLTLPRGPENNHGKQVLGSISTQTLVVESFLSPTHVLKIITRYVSTLGDQNHVRNPNLVLT